MGKSRCRCGARDWRMPFPVPRCRPYGRCRSRAPAWPNGRFQIGEFCRLQVQRWLRVSSVIPFLRRTGSRPEIVKNRAKAAAYTSAAARERSISDWAAQLLADAEFLNDVFVTL